MRTPQAPRPEATSSPLTAKCCPSQARPRCNLRRNPAKFSMEARTSTAMAPSWSFPAWPHAGKRGIFVNLSRSGSFTLGTVWTTSAASKTAWETAPPPNPARCSRRDLFRARLRGAADFLFRTGIGSKGSRAETKTRPSLTGPRRACQLLLGVRRRFLSRSRPYVLRNSIPGPATGTGSHGSQSVSFNSPRTSPARLAGC